MDSMISGSTQQDVGQRPSFRVKLRVKEITVPDGFPFWRRARRVPIDEAFRLAEEKDANLLALNYLAGIPPVLSLVAGADGPNVAKLKQAIGEPVK